MSKLVPPMSTATKSPTPGGLRRDRRAHHAAGRSAREQRDRASRHVVGRHDAAGRLHDQQRTEVARRGAACPAGSGCRRRCAARRTRSRAWSKPARTRDRAASPRARARCARRRGTPPTRSRACGARARGSRTRTGTSRRSIARRASSGVARRGAPRPRRARAAVDPRSSCVPESGCAPAGARSGSGPDSSGPRSLLCDSGAARSRRGGPR